VDEARQRKEEREGWCGAAMVLERRKGEWVGRRLVTLPNVPSLLSSGYLMAMCV